MILTSNACRLLRLAVPVAALAASFVAPSSARAYFFDGARKTFTADIPHFFQDDIPCFFGGQPTSGTKKSCKSFVHPARPVTDKNQRIANPSDKANDEAGDSAKPATNKDRPATAPSDK
jgi:hypothetical protein